MHPGPRRLVGFDFDGWQTKDVLPVVLDEDKLFTVRDAFRRCEAGHQTLHHSPSAAVARSDRTLDTMTAVGTERARHSNVALLVCQSAAFAGRGDQVVGRASKLIPHRKQFVLVQLPAAHL